MNDNENITLSAEPPLDRIKSIKNLIDLGDIKKAKNEFNKLSSTFPKSNELKKLSQFLDPFIEQENKLQIKYENLFNTESETLILQHIQKDQIQYPNSSMLYAYIGRLQLSKKIIKNLSRHFLKQLN